MTLIGVKSKYGSGWGTSPGLININDTPPQKKKINKNKYKKKLKKRKQKKKSVRGA